MLRNYCYLAAAETETTVVMTGFVDLPAVAVAAEAVTVGLPEKATAAAAISADTVIEVDALVGSAVRIVALVAAVAVVASETSYVATTVGMIVAFVYAAADASVQG